MEKLSYIHNNPFEYGLCSTPWEYKFSSASDYAERELFIKVKLLSMWKRKPTLLE
jgi:hypothetical protein